MMRASLAVGFIGTGIMGLPMARRVAGAGYRVAAWNRTRDKAAPLVSAGIEVVGHASETARDADVVICMLSSGAACDDLLLGDDGIVARMRAGSVLIVMSSIPVDTAQRHAQAAAARDVGYLDAPVSGGEKGAQDGTLAIMAGGEAEVFERVRAVLQTMGRPTRIGPAGTGQLAKLVNQMMVASTIATVAEAMLLAERGGADPAQVRAALLGGFADSTILRQHAARMIAQDFKPGGPAKYQIKDTKTALGFAHSVGLELPVLGLVDGLFTDMVEHGDGELDHSALIRELRRRNGLPVA
ncbi:MULTISPECIES: NAD(P)-dependent oxidoreductase [unclassified Caballeronia]|jgi:3-hydroxyisobutyrate dehydrogenase-like beta-hydroxyacid dehydrogenase|uniref:NAD(P)-dependent oxidoreductase n=1 Tax=unclassified Caballeronia TaxID=2646786 RepID=UPI00202908C2|nr:MULTISPECIES: NAD(P)-dependent oxidoreductase [unclassified Caballeronia]